MQIPPELASALIVFAGLLILGVGVYAKALIDRQAEKIKGQTAQMAAATEATKRNSELENIGLQHAKDVAELNLKLQTTVTDVFTRMHAIELAAEKDRSLSALQIADLRTAATTASENRANAQELLNMEREARERVERQAKDEQDVLKKRVDELAEENKTLREQVTGLNAKITDLETRDKERHDAINETSARESERELYFASLIKMNELVIGKLNQLSDGNPDLKDWLTTNGVKTTGDVNVLTGLTTRLRDKDSAIRARDEHIARLNDQIAELQRAKYTTAAESVAGESASR